MTQDHDPAPLKGAQVVYENTPENAKRVGWAYQHEYCVGNRRLPYVIHDRERGLFFFSTMPGVHHDGC